MGRMSGIGHNGSPPDPFDQDATAVKARRTEAALNRLQVAIRDPGLDRGHLKVLANITENINKNSGTAWPSRATIAKEEGMSHKTVHNDLYDLRDRHYLDWKRRPHPTTGRNLTQYTLPVTRHDRESLENAIEKALEEVRSQKSALQGGQSEVPSGEGSSNGKCPPERAVSGKSALQGGLKSALPRGNRSKEEENGISEGESRPHLNGSGIDGKHHPDAGRRVASGNGSASGSEEPQATSSPHRSAEDQMAAALSGEPFDAWWAADGNIEITAEFKRKLEQTFPNVALNDVLAIVGDKQTSADGRRLAHGAKLKSAVERQCAYLNNDNRLKSEKSGKPKSFDPRRYRR
jgi:hypothetical protein